MRPILLHYPSLLIAVLLGLGGEVAQAGPIVTGRELQSASVSADTPQASEYRSGIQEQLNGNIETAKEHFDASLRIDPAYAPALIGLAAVAQSQGSLAQAEIHLKEAERVSPRAPEVHLAWGRYYLSTSEIAKAETSFRTSHDLAPRQIPPLLELGDLYMSLPGRAADAMQAFQSAVAIDANNGFAQYGLGAAAVANGSQSVAMNALRRAAEIVTDDPGPHRIMGLLYMADGKPEEALAAFDTGLARQPRFVPIKLDRADALGRLGRFDEAVAQLEDAEKQVPDAGEIKTKLGDAHQAAGRFDEAEKYYLQAIELAKQNPIAYNNLAWMTVERKGDAAKAVELARKAVLLSPSSSPFHDTLGWAEQFAGNMDGAAESYQHAIELEPNVAGYHYHLGVVQAELKQSDAARISLERALQLDANLPEAEEARRLITSLAAR